MNSGIEEDRRHMRKHGCLILRAAGEQGAPTAVILMTSVSRKGVSFPNVNESPLKTHG